MVRKADVTGINLNDYDRVFCFGCSWTNYRWPSWADLCRYSTDKPVYNWGIPGIGNVGIYHRMVEASFRYGFTDRDLIMVQWSTWNREDRYFDKWEAHGCVFDAPIYNEPWALKYWSWNNDIIKNATAIISAQKFFNIGFQFTFHGFPIASDHRYDDPYYNPRIFEFYKKQLPVVPNFPREFNEDFENTCHDGHADIRAHLIFFSQYLKPIGFNLTDKYAELENLNSTISKRLNRSQTDIEQWKIIEAEVDKFDKKIYETYKNWIGF